ncbi:serine hydrolase [Streptomyces sp. ME02-8801-2C]|uniref:serine hydrolase domain-containing protein n=1 Tax=Streptomyces sp. ME02-8801-2C TaxID=3028680 RepID=UPI0029BD7504|nr:serine hydrolase domain-containing protein [Streptomyces sp. ME02-8801-2C]MDX3451268.1 serine hydrolase [Streptomyces sp. ME02-8801-2C]
MHAHRDGLVAPGFGKVADAFAAELTRSSRGGAALTVMVDGEKVVDLWGGAADADNGRAWGPNTPTVTFSCSKGLLALLVARLVAAGKIGLDLPAGTYWPEFGQAGKENIPVRWLLSHQAGLSYPTEDITRDDVLAWHPVVDKLAAQAPLWEPGTGHGYHALTYGWLVGEVVRRVTGQSVGEAFTELVTGPLGARAWFGVPQEELASVAVLAMAPEINLDLLPFTPEFDPVRRAFTLGGAFPATVAGNGTGLSDPAIQAAEVPGGGAVATARALAEIWSSTILPTSATQPLPEDVLTDMVRVQSSGPQILGLQGIPQPSWGTGFMIDSPDRPFLTSSSFGHDGTGGQLAFADPAHGVGFGFVTNDVQGAAETRTLDILDALRNAL